MTQISAPESQGFDSRRLARIRPKMQTYVDTGNFSGITTLIARRGKVVHFDHTGVRDKAGQQPLDSSTIFRIYSMTKPVVCTALMTLYEEARFHLSDPIAKYLPAFAKVKVWDGEAQPLVNPVRPILIRDLFTHTAGLTYNFLEDTPVSRMYLDAGLFSDSGASLESIITELARLPLAYQPGSRWHYSMSIDVLAHLIEVLAGRPLQHVLRERVFSPLGMSDTGFSVSAQNASRVAAMYGHADIATHQFTEIAASAVGPVDVSKTYPTDNTTTFARGGHGLFSTAADFLRFAQMLLNRGELDGERIISPAIADLMHSNHLPPNLMPYNIAIVAFPGYGFGLGSRVLLDPAASGLPGSVGEFGWAGAANTYFWVDPKKELVGIFMTQHMISTEPAHRDFPLLTYQALMD
ncbi:MAG TPA: serine hydrolase domain-containing protein [Bryobacteraceae bacterium]|nr:serine hydrolase domain-containing protein [Bryobacteraceae bacterium]